MGLSELKGQARQALHSAMAEPASYSFGGVTYPTPEQSLAGLSLTVRWHTKMKIVGERTSDDVGLFEGVNRLVFSQPELDALELSLTRLGVISIPGYEKQLRLDHREESDGPHNAYWSVIEL